MIASSLRNGDGELRSFAPQSVFERGGLAFLALPAFYATWALAENVAPMTDTVFLADRTGSRTVTMAWASVRASSMAANCFLNLLSSINLPLRRLQSSRSEKSSI